MQADFYSMRTTVSLTLYPSVLLLLLLASAGCGDRPERAEGIDTTAGAPAIEEMAATRRDTAGAAAVDTAAASEPRTAPDFELPTLSGEPFHLAAHRGEVVLLNFWATWCAPCRVEIPDFIELQEDLGDDGLQIVGISVDAGGFEDVRPFAEEMGINYPIVVDIGELSEMYGGVYALPTSILIDRQGRMVRKIPGMLTEETLRPMLEALLAEPGAG